MTDLYQELIGFKDYRFSLIGYKQNHSELILHAVNHENLSLRYEIGFGDVSYIQMPLDWVGSFEFGTDDEKEEIIRLTGLQSRMFASTIRLYEASFGKILILGALMQIKFDNSK